MRTEYDDSLEDERFEAEVQTMVDDEQEARDIEAKRNAIQTSPEILSLQEAYIEGQRAGHLNLSASLNPYQAGCPEHDEWERGRSNVIGAFLNNLRRVA